ncbi:MAG: hypothetical protein K6C94_00940 [Candidatus Gastranaerophilales bacterium]|nr:hypothetical protein [Candidatus Gastranaerophilales bacterium]
MIIKIFMITSFLFFCELLTGVLYFYRHQNRFIKEKSVMLGAWALVFYIFSAFLTIFYVKYSLKPIIFLCSVSPFIIGYYSSYKKLMFFTVLQLLVIVIGVLVVL